MEISITAGNPDAAELAALVVALRGRGAPPNRRPHRASAWRDPARRLGVDRDWRASTLPG